MPQPASVTSLLAIVCAACASSPGQPADASDASSGAAAAPSPAERAVPRGADGGDVPPDGGTSSGPACTARATSSLLALAKASTDPCHAWVERFRGRVGRGTIGSFAIWTKRTPSALPLIVGAIHTLGSGALASDGTAVARRLTPANSEDGLLRLFWPPPDGSSAPPQRAVAFRFFHPAVSANENGSGFAKLRPRNDFYIEVSDPQRFMPDPLNEPLPDVLQNGPVAVFDPANLTTSTPSFGKPAAGTLVAFAGFPKTGPFAEGGAVGFGAILSDADAISAITSLQQAGDQEGTIPYDPEAEMVISGEGLSGMSGGGVFDDAGRLAGILVRASFAPATKYVRAVRLSFVAASLEAARAGLPSATASAVAPWMPAP